MTIFEYHTRTFHYLDRFAPSLGYLDFATMPSPFREYRGAPILALPRESAGAWPPVSYDQLCVPGIVPPAPVDIRSLGSFLRHAMGLSAWKQAGRERWSLRVNPSSGNLHPTEAYVVLGVLAGLGGPPGVYHYRPDIHALELRCALPGGAEKPGASAGGPGPLDDALSDAPRGGFLVGLSSILWREAWKYGERAYRYCQHDVGHAVAALAFSASLLGWDLAVLHAWSDAVITTLLGLDRLAPESEREEAECLALVSPGALDRSRLPLESPPLVTAARHGEWLGLPVQLSADHVEWPALEAGAGVAARPAGALVPAPPKGLPARLPLISRPIDARALVLRRRSALDFDPRFVLDSASFARILERLLPQASAPWTALGLEAAIHLAVFVHRVDGLAPGLYALVRGEDAQPDLRAAMRPAFEWRRVPGSVRDLPLFLLHDGDVRAVATRVSCDQPIAGDGCFSVGMIARFEEPITRYGAWYYRRLFWEAGAIGQVLYLEAEAAGARGTGIGCYYDPAIHDVLGLSDATFQSLYHFAVGAPIEDPRLLTFPGYDWESG